MVVYRSNKTVPPEIGKGVDAVNKELKVVGSRESNRRTNRLSQRETGDDMMGGGW